MADWRTDDRELLARILMAEAGNQGPTGMTAVGNVIMNRANTGGYGGDIRSVIMKPGQFSPMNSVTGYAGGEQGQDIDGLRPSETNYMVADALLSGNAGDITGGATHFFNPDISNPSWAEGKDFTRIGDHVFGSADAGRGGNQPTQGRASTQGAGPMTQDNQRPQGLLGAMGIQKMQEGAAGETGQRFYNRDTFKDVMGNMAMAANTLRMRPDDSIAGQVQSKRDRRDTSKVRNKTVEWLAKQPGGETFAEMIRAGGSPAAVLQAYQQSTTATTKPTTDIQNYEYYRAQELSEGRTPLPIAAWSIMDEEATVPPGPDSGKFSEESAKFIVKNAGEYATAGQSATRALRQLDVLEGALANSPGGAVAGAKSWLGGLGVKTEGLDDIQLANAIISQLVPAQRPVGSGTMSDADLAMFKASLPALMNTPGGNTKIISTMRNIANYDIQMGNISRQLLLQEITPRHAYDAYADIPDPLADFTAGAAPAATGGPVLRYNPETGEIK